MRICLTTAAFLVALLTASPRAWDSDIHQRLTLQAVDGLPAPVRELLAPHREFISEHSIDPDLWRIVGLRTDLGPESANHFLDIDVLDEPAPFTGVPRDWDAYVKRYGAERAERAGRLPWRIVDIHARLVAAFKGVRAKTPPYAESEARYLTAVLAHYVEDSFQPLHAVGNYDGQLTNQRGIHSRFEGEAPRRYWSTLRHTPVQIRAIADIKSFAFETLTSGASLAQRILDADRAAAQGTTNYDDGYYERFFAGIRDVLEQRLNGSADGVASVVANAWEASGK